MVLGDGMTPASIVGCAEKIIDATLLVRFHFLYISSELCDIHLTFACLLDRFLDTLGSLLLICDTIGFWIPWVHNSKKWKHHCPLR